MIDLVEQAIVLCLGNGLDRQIADRLATDFTPELQNYYREQIGKYAVERAS